jgi:hypothetical protein
MRLQDIVTTMRVELLDQNGTLYPDDDLIDLATEAESEFCRETRVYEMDSQLATVSGVYEYNLPEAWVGAKLLMNADLDDNDNQTWHRLEPTSLEKIAQEIPDFLSPTQVNTGNPRYYWVDGQETLYVYPRPQEGSTIKLFFVGTPPPFTSITDQIHIPKELANAIKYYLMAKCMSKGQDPESETKYWNLWLSMVKKGHKWRNKRQLDARNTLGGLDRYGRSGYATIDNPLNL